MVPGIRWWGDDRICALRRIRNSRSSSTSPQTSQGHLVASIDTLNNGQGNPHGYSARKPSISSYIKPLALLSSLASLAFVGYRLPDSLGRNHGLQVPLHAAEIQARCRVFNTKPGPFDLHDRIAFDRSVEVMEHVWIRNATIWTGRVQGP